MYEKSSVRSLHIFLNAKHFYFCHFFLSFFVTVKLKKNKSKSDKSKSAWHSRKYVTTELNFFHIQFDVPRVRAQSSQGTENECRVWPVEQLGGGVRACTEIA